MKKIILAAGLTSGMFLGAANAAVYVDGAVSHFNDRFANPIGRYALTQKVGIQALGVSASVGYMDMANEVIFGGELGLGYNFGGIKGVNENHETKKSKSPLHANLVGKVGAKINAESALYGILGVGYQRLSLINVKGNLNQVDLVVGAGLSTTVSKDVSVFVEYLYNRPLKAGSVTDGAVKIKFWNETQTFKIGARYFFN